MAISVDVQEDVRNITLSGVLDIEQAAECKGVMMDALASPLPIRVQVAAVTDIDVTILQLLWAAAAQATSAGSDLIVEGPLSEAIQISLSGTGLFPLIASLVRSEQGVGRALSIRN